MLYCSKCKKYTDGICPKKLVMITNISIKRTSRCAECLAIKSFFDKINDKGELETIVAQAFTLLNLIKQKMLIYCVKCRKILKI